MAARRLVILMLVVLGISTIAAALVPTDPEQRTTSESTTAAEPAADRPRGRLVRRKVDAAGSTDVVRVRVGDQLQLMVAAARADQVEVGGLGELEEVDPDTPASFDLLASRPGVHPILLLDAGRTIGRIVITKPRKPAKSKDRRGAT